MKELKYVIEGLYGLTPEAQENLYIKLMKRKLKQTYRKDIPKPVRTRLELESEIIIGNGYASRLLIMSVLMDYARSRRIAVVPVLIPGFQATYILGASEVDAAALGKRLDVTHGYHYDRSPYYVLEVPERYKSEFGELLQDIDEIDLFEENKRANQLQRLSDRLGTNVYGINPSSGTLMEALKTTATDIGTGIQTMNQILMTDGFGKEELIYTRDDVFELLIRRGLEEKTALVITELVRKGRGAVARERYGSYMLEMEVPICFVENLEKYRYLPAKKDAASIAIAEYRIKKLKELASV